MIESILVATGVLVGYFIGRGVKEVPHITAEEDDSWDIRVVATDSPSMYRAIYKQNGSVRYSVTGRGVTGAMDALIKEIQSP